jgi:hypothetical protein
MSAHHDNGEFREPVMQTLQELHAVYAGEPDIQQDKRWFQGIEPLPEAFRIGKGDGLIPLVLQYALYCGRDGGFVVYDTDRIHIRLFAVRPSLK